MGLCFSRFRTLDAAITLGICLRCAVLCFGRFRTLDAASCIRDGFEALGADGIATIVADAVISVVDALERLLD